MQNIRSFMEKMANHQAGYTAPDHEVAEQGESHEDESYEMLCNALTSIGQNAEKLHEMIKAGQEMPAWVTFKIAQAQQTMAMLSDYAEAEAAE
jgi:hypothetical protein